MANLQKVTRRICQECFRPLPKAKKPLPKYTRRVPIKLLVDGVMTWPDGRQKCVTKKAWRKRREEVWERDHGNCQHCGHALQPHEAHIHHLRKRSVGRDDRMSNLLTLCVRCHLHVHERKP